MLKKRDVADVSVILLLFTSLLLMFQYIEAYLPFQIFAGLTIGWAAIIGYMIYKRRQVENKLISYLETLGEDNQ